jgi:hypothetical protein
MRCHDLIIYITGMILCIVWNSYTVAPLTAFGSPPYYASDKVPSGLATFRA